MLTHYQFNSNTQARGSEHGGKTHGGKNPTNSKQYQTSHYLIEIVGRKSVSTAYGFKSLETTVLRIVSQ